MGSKDYGDTTVIMPTLNEAKNIGKLIKIIASSYRRMQVVVADDGSTDGTKEIVRKISKGNKNVRLLDRGKEEAHGLTASVMDAGRGASTEFLVVIDGDLQHPPEKLREVVAKLREGNDIVIGTRKKVMGKWPLQRRLMSAAATAIARTRLMRNIRDPMSGFFGCKTRVFRKVLEENEGRFEKKGYKVLFDLLKCLPTAKVAEVGYAFGERKRGESKIGMRQAVLFVRSLFR